MTVVTPRETTSTVAPVDPVAPQLEAKPEVKDEQLSPKFAALARQQKEIRQQQLALKAEREALAAEKARMEQEYSTKYIPRDKLKSDPYSVLEEEGIPYDQIVNSVMNQDPQAKALRTMEKRIESFEQKLEREKQEAVEKQNKQYEQAVNKIRTDVKLLVDKDNTFEAIKANAAEEAVVELIKSTFESDGVVMSVEDAANKIEEYLLEEAVKLAALEKVKKRLAPPEPVQAAAPSPKSQVKTLTNATTMTPAKPMTQKERRERAIAAFKGQLT